MLLFTTEKVNKCMLKRVAQNQRFFAIICFAKACISKVFDFLATICKQSGSLKNQRFFRYHLLRKCSSAYIIIFHRASSRKTITFAKACISKVFDFLATICKQMYACMYKYFFVSKLPKNIYTYMLRFIPYYG